MLNILKLFGIDVPARMAELQARLEQRVELAKDHVRQAAQTAAVVVVAALLVLAGLTVLSALGVGLIALYRWVLLNYGQFYGLAAVGGVLILIAIILLAGAMLEAKSWSGEGAAEDAGKRLKRAELQARADRVAAQAAAALDRPAPPPVLLSAPALAPTSAGDLVEPLSLILSKVITFPTTGNPVLDDLLLHLRGSAQGVADEAVEGVVRTVRYDDRTNVIAVLGTAVFVGWLLARHHPDHATRGQHWRSLAPAAPP
jgi:hypothetical protein